MTIPEPAEPPTVESTEVVPQTAPSSQSALVIAIIWAILAAIFAIVLFASATDESYGGDAYTGMQNAVVLAVRGIAFLLIGSGALGLIIALRRDRR